MVISRRTSHRVVDTDALCDYPLDLFILAPHRDSLKTPEEALDDLRRHRLRVGAFAEKKLNKTSLNTRTLVLTMGLHCLYYALPIIIASGVFIRTRSLRVL
ncbi:hypothetical protein OG21DRAFT_1517518, partial [Imleria badia]